MTRPVATVLIPARDEHDAIAGCLERVLAQTVDRSSLEVVVVDGGSADGTASVAVELLSDAGLASWQVLTNPVGTTPSNLNVGLAAATGAVLCRVDARSVIPPDYVAGCVAVLEARPDVVVVGGRQVAVARDDSPRAVGIARALNNRYGMGGARYRRGAASGPADTVYLGAFRTDELRAAGGWDERWSTNQDFELNRRMAARGTVWFEAGLAVGYLPRRDLAGLWRQYVRFGRWKVRYWRQSGDRPRPRQLVLLVGPVVAAVAAGIGWRRLGRGARTGAVAAGIVVVGGVEVAGPSGPPGTLTAHVMSASASAVVALGWLWGVYAEWFGLGTDRR